MSYDSLEEVRAAEGRWARLRDKVEETLDGLEGRAVRRRQELTRVVEALLETPMKASTENQELTTSVVVKVDEARRAYAIYDALRSVLLWMDGYGPATSHLEREVERLRDRVAELECIVVSNGGDRE